MFVGMERSHKETHPSRKSYRTQAEREQWEQELMEEAEHHSHRFTSLAASLLPPIIVLLSLPGLTEHFLGTFFLILRLVETHPRFCTFTGAFCLLLHLILNITSLSIFAIQHGEPDGYVLSTAFWLTASSACVAFVVLCCLGIDFFLTDRFRTRGTGLSGKQRSLVVSFTLFLAVCCVSSVVAKYMNDVSFLNALYFVIQSFITTGFGDEVPRTNASRGVFILLNTIGIVMFSIVIAFTRATALEAMQREYKRNEKLVVGRLRRRMTRSSSRRSDDTKDVDSWARRMKRWIHLGRDKEEEKEEEELEEDDDEKKDLHEQDFEEAIVELTEEQRREFRSEVVVSFGIFLIVWLVGAAVYHKLEGWTFFISFYFMFISMSSIGYGDYFPSTPAGRAFFVVWALVGAGSLTVFFSVMADAYSSRFKQTFQRSWLSRMMTMIYTDKALERQIFEEEEAAQLNKHGRFEGKKSEPGPEQDAATATEDKEEKGKGQADQLSLSSSSSAQQAHGKEAKKEQHLAEALVMLIVDTKEHIEELIRSDGGTGGKTIQSVVNSLMDEQDFSSRNRTKVQNDEDLRRFLYLRRLQAKLAALESLAKDAIADSKGEPREAHEVVEGNGEEGEKKVSGTESPAAEMKRRVAEDREELRRAESSEEQDE
ncbi:hypothetical protein BCR35DRAFT_340121 [Leucosporidium creatinivorum]|uniref:Potassium channel domain-containing protein n=1 Tax=Leucosporidium creatinivorum TaxID=106004 RepID=A0A1Y2FJI2_9BASI|nr:hypothetical protein BCR35DRAFT_340121 [Leucosporidium creatinivorum]